MKNTEIKNEGIETYVMALEDQAIRDIKNIIVTIKSFDPEIKINKYPGLIIFIQTKLTKGQLRSIKGIHVVEDIPLYNDLISPKV